MKRYIYIFSLFFTLSISGYTQDWSSCGSGFTNIPYALYSDTISHKIYVSGFGAEVNGIQANSIASWDGLQWDTLGHGAIGAYGGFLIRYKNKLYLQRNYNIYAWDFTTLMWDSVPGGQVAGDVTSMVIDNNNDLIIAGDFAKIGSVNANRVARFDGTNFFPIGNPSSCYYVNSVAIYHNEIYIGGNFGGDTVHSAIAKWDGSNWVGVNYGFRQGGPPEVVSLKVYHDRLYAGGAFYGTIGKYMPSLAAWDGSKWNDVGGIYNHNFPWGVVYTMLEFKNKLYVMGDFGRADDLDVDNIAIWNDTNWCATNIYSNGIVGLATMFQNKLYIAQHETVDNDSVHLLGYYIGSDYYGTCGRPVGINEIKISDDIKIYPNPANSIINISDEQNELQNATIEITNSIGQTFITVPFNSSIDVSSLSTGCYFINITTLQRQVLHAKFIKE